MKKIILHENKGVFSFVRLALQGEIVSYEKYHWGNREVLKFHSSLLSGANTFSRIYHLGLIVSSIFIGSLSTILLIKKWGTMEWTFYLAVIPLIIIALGYIYYFLRGRKYGEVEIQIYGRKKQLYMTLDKYKILREFMESLTNN